MTTPAWISAASPSSYGVSLSPGPDPPKASVWARRAGCGRIFRPPLGPPSVAVEAVEMKRHPRRQHQPRSGVQKSRTAEVVDGALVTVVWLEVSGTADDLPDEFGSRQVGWMQRENVRQHDALVPEVFFVVCAVAWGLGRSSSSTQAPVRHSAVQAAIGELVDGLGFGAGRLVANAEGEMVEVEPPLLVLGELVHEAERASRRRNFTQPGRLVPSLASSSHANRASTAWPSRSRRERVSSPIRRALLLALRRSSCQASSSKATGA